jgi:hypothetical protein
MDSSSVFYRRPPRWTYPEIVRPDGAYLYDRVGTRCYLDASPIPIPCLALAPEG